MTPEKSRIRNLSTRYLKFYKYVSAVFVFVCIIGLSYYRYTKFKEEHDFLQFLVLLPPCTLAFFGLKAARKVYKVEFDDEFMYVAQGKQELLIPLENIKDFNLIDLGGVYQVELYSKESFGERFYFLPSLLFVFNHKKKEALVDVLWANIEKAKSKKHRVKTPLGLSVFRSRK